MSTGKLRSSAMEATYRGVTTPDWMRERCTCWSFYGAIEPASRYECPQHGEAAESWRDGVRAAQEHLASLLPTLPREVP